MPKRKATADRSIPVSISLPLSQVNWMDAQSIKPRLVLLAGLDWFMQTKDKYDSLVRKEKEDAETIEKLQRIQDKLYECLKDRDAHIALLEQKSQQSEVRDEP